jgi:hypothetical protein
VLSNKSPGSVSTAAANVTHQRFAWIDNIGAFLGGVEDVRADPTGPQRADTSGGRDKQDQAWLAGAHIEQRAHLADVPDQSVAAGRADRWLSIRLPT